MKIGDPSQLAFQAARLAAQARTDAPGTGHGRHDGGVTGISTGAMTVSISPQALVAAENAAAARPSTASVEALALLSARHR